MPEEAETTPEPLFSSGIYRVPIGKTGEATVPNV
jgi:hypothetical protein